MVLTVTYDLHNPGRDYDNIAKTLKSATSWAHPQGSVWFIDTSQSPMSWVKKLRAAGDPNDEYFVTRFAKDDWGSVNMDADVVSWLSRSGRNW